MQTPRVDRNAGGDLGEAPPVAEESRKIQLGKIMNNRHGNDILLVILSEDNSQP
jgi:hypothetical protein